MAADNTANGKRRLRSREWFDDPDDPAMTALYLERYMNFGLTRGELHGGGRSSASPRPAATSSPCNRHHLDLAAACATASATPAAFRSSSRSIRSRRPASGRPRRSTAISPISPGRDACTATPLDGVVLTTGCDKTTPAC